MKVIFCLWGLILEVLLRMLGIVAPFRSTPLLTTLFSFDGRSFDRYDSIMCSFCISIFASQGSSLSLVQYICLAFIQVTCRGYLL